MVMPARYKEHLPAWLQAYADGESVWQIGEQYGAPGQTVYKYLKKAGVTLRSKEVATRAESIRANAFDAPLSAEAAYWLGLLYADGSHVVARKTGASIIGLVAHRDDEESIIGFLSFLGLTGPVQRRGDKQATETRVTSKTLAARLSELGVVPRKTHILQWPDELNDELSPAFVRGFFDGDGSIYSRTPPRYVTPQAQVTIVGAPAFIEGMASRIERLCGVVPSHLGWNSRGKSRALLYNGRLKLLRLRSWLYADSGPCLSRKRRAFEQIPSSKRSSI